MTLSREVMNKHALISIVAVSCCLCMLVSPTSPKNIHTLSHPDETPHMYVRAWTLCCFHSRISRGGRPGLPSLISLRFLWTQSNTQPTISSQSFRRSLTAPVDSCANIKSAPAISGVTNACSVWAKVPESDARIVLSFIYFREAYL